MKDRQVAVSGGTMNFVQRSTDGAMPQPDERTVVARRLYSFVNLPRDQAV